MAEVSRQRPHGHGKTSASLLELQASAWNGTQTDRQRDRETS